MRRILLAGVVLVGCGATTRPVNPHAERAQLALAAEDRMIVIPEGKYIAGSTPEERGASYDDLLAATQSDAAREMKRFEREEARHQSTLPAYLIDLMPVTQGQFAEFVAAGKAHAIMIDEAAWQAQGFAHDYATQVARYVWKAGVPPNERLDHPVVLVTWDEANRYCAWRGELTGANRRLPTAAEFEKAARGDGGVTYPWGNAFDPAKLNSADAGPKDTVPVGSFTTGASPYGVLEMAGNVAQWTATPGDGGMMIVKGSAWDDHAGVGRGAGGDARKPGVRHVGIGFRCAGTP
jgi:formylglycine-generating enzyme required for sulfatase activity